MKPIKIDLSSDLTELKLESFFDLHIGSPKCDVSLIHERIDRVLKNPDTFCILGGDLLNNSIVGSVAEADLFESPASPTEQLNTAIRLFRPLADAGKILGVCCGNHEMRTYKKTGIDLMERFCSELNLLDRYDYVSCLLFIRFGDLGGSRHHKKVCYTCMFSHGMGQGGKLVGSKANGLQKRGEIIPNCDIVVTGHTHSPITFKDAYFEIDYGQSCIRKKERLFVNVGATLNYEQYAELVGCKPSSTASPVIVLDGRRKFAKVVM